MQGKQAIGDEATASAEDALPIELPEQADADSSEQETCKTRRHFLGRSAKKLAYITPVVLLLRPRPACASRIYS